MDTTPLLRCTDAFTACFTDVYEDDLLLRYRDPELPDMYDHNFTMIKLPVDDPRLPELIREEMALYRREGFGHCQVRLAAPPAEALLAALPLRPFITDYVLCATDKPESLRLRERVDCTVERVDTPAMARERIDLETVCYSEAFGEDFLRRKGERHAAVYLSDEGVDSYLCRAGGVAVGKADLFLHEGVAMIEDFDVLPDRRRQGYGTAIIRHLVDRAIERGAEKILFVADLDDTAKDLYAGIGCTLAPGRSQLLFFLPKE